MEFLGDVDEVEAYFDPFGDSVNLDARLSMVCTERTTCSEINMVAVNEIWSAVYQGVCPR
jgi:hypothetical protein